MSGGHVLPHGSRHDANSPPGISARKRIPRVYEHSAFAAHRFAHQRHRPPWTVQRGRVDLHELPIGEFRAGPRGERQSLPERAERVRGVAKQAADASGREDHAAGERN